MRRYLVVANRTVGGQHLLDAVRGCMEAGPCSFHVVVPASHSASSYVETEGQARAAAAGRLQAALQAFRELGADADGEVGDHRPLEAIADALRHGEYDEIILSTLPPGVSRWLRQDLPHRVERWCRLPVTHVVAERTAAGV